MANDKKKRKVHQNDECKIEKDANNQVTLSNIDEECIHEYQYKCTSRTALKNCVNNGTDNKTVVVWTGHITDGHEVSTLFPSSNVIVITTYGKVQDINNDNIYEFVDEIDVRLNNEYSLMHELAHSLNADDHYCKRDFDENDKCSNPACDECHVLGQDGVRFFIMGKREDLATLLSQNTFCSSCVILINEHINDHH